MKRFVSFIIIFAVLFSVCSCYPGDADYYETRFDELDIHGRINEAAYAIEHNSANALTVFQLKKAAEDLKFLNTHGNGHIEDINKDFISAVNMLTVAAEKQIAQEEYLSYYEMAKEQYNLANLELDTYKVSVPED